MFLEFPKYSQRNKRTRRYSNGDQRKNPRFQIIQICIPLHKQSTKSAEQRQDEKKTFRNITQEEAGKAALCH